MQHGESCDLALLSTGGTPVLRGNSKASVLLPVLFLVLLISIPVNTGRVGAARHASTIVEIANLSSATDAFKNDVGRYPTNFEGLGALVKTPPGTTGRRGLGRIRGYQCYLMDGAP